MRAPSDYLAGEGEFLDEEAFGYLPPERTLLLCTGSQGEPRAALARIAEETHPAIALEAGDTVVFSSKTIPGNEKAVAAVINNLARQGILVVTADQAPVHTSGHPRQDELRQFYQWLKPQLLVPMHGEAWHLESHAAFARSCGIPEVVVIDNGEMLRLAPGACRGRRPDAGGPPACRRAAHRAGRRRTGPDAPQAVVRRHCLRQPGARRRRRGSPPIRR